MPKKPKAEAIPNHTGIKVPGAGGARKKFGQVKDVVEQIESEDTELDVKQAGGEEPW